MVSLLYELFLAVGAAAVLYQYVVWLAAHEVTAVGTDIAMLEMPAEFLAPLGQLRRVHIGFDEEHQ
jgi:hypothetical protein